MDVWSSTRRTQKRCIYRKAALVHYSNSTEQIVLLFWRLLGFIWLDIHVSQILFCKRRETWHGWQCRDSIYVHIRYWNSYSYGRSIKLDKLLVFKKKCPRSFYCYSDLRYPIANDTRFFSIQVPYYISDMSTLPFVSLCSSSPTIGCKYLSFFLEEIRLVCLFVLDVCFRNRRKCFKRHDIFGIRNSIMFNHVYAVVWRRLQRYSGSYWS